jgi:plastocyanin
MQLGRFHAAVAALLFACACGSSGSSNPSNPSNPAGPSAPGVTPTITIIGQSGTQAFSPNPADFGGQSVVFRNTDNVAHRVILHDGDVDTGVIAPGATSRAVTIPAGGTHYHCSVHPGMIGSVNSSGGTTAPPCEGIYCTAY